jgi:hypothetical protein
MNRRELRGFGISVILIVVMLAVSVTQTTRGQASYDKIAIQNQLEAQLKELIVENYSQYYKDVGVSLTPKDVAIRDGIASAVLDARIDLTLKAERIEDLPFMKGMLECLDSKRSIATKAQIDESNRLLEDWRLELRDYIGKPESAAYATYKIVANVNDDSTTEKDGVKLYVSEPSLTNRGEDFYLVPSPMLETPEEMGKAGAALIEEVFKRMTSFCAVDGANGLRYTYDRLAARDYANQWVSATAPDNGTCLMDPSKWNTTQYPRYTNDYCADCADYASQAMHAGGIPIDSGQWDRLRDGNGTYSWAWTSASSLKNYMINKGHWTSSNFTQANAGNIMRMLNYDGHTVMIVLNDTITRKYSAHTSDRKQYVYYDNSNYEYYIVQ